MTKQLVVVLAIVRDRAGRYLLGRRNEPEIPAIHEKWNLLGGKLEYGETPEEAVVREVKEESGLEVRALGMLSRTFIRYREKADGTRLQIVELPFLCVPIHEEYILREEDPKVDKLAFFTWSEIESLDLIEGEREVLEETRHISPEH
jgi:mutator protein MutT